MNVAADLALDGVPPAVKLGRDVLDDDGSIRLVGMVSPGLGSIR